MEPASVAAASELEKHWPDLVRFSRSLTGNVDLADDIAQESMARALKRGNSLHAVSNPQGWLFQIAVNVFREWWRKRSCESDHLRRLAEIRSVHPASMPDGTAGQREHLEMIWKFIESLPEMQRKVIKLHLVDGCSHDEIARQLATNSDNVKANLSLVRRKLRERFLDKSREDIR